jgi:molybdate transport system substrate-binding protein
MKFPTRVTLTMILGLLASAIPMNAQQLRIAAAADLKFAMAELLEEFEKGGAAKVDASYGSSGNFFSQIENGAPFDLFFSADAEYPKKLEAAGMTEPGTLFQYALGRIVIWAPSDNRLNAAGEGWKVLLDDRVKKIAIANPEHSPYGRAALSALKAAGIYEQVKPKLVYGENISQAAQFVQSGNAQAGIVALSLALSPAMKNGDRWDVPPNMHPPIEQTAVILKGAKNKPAAHAFLEFVKSSTGREILQRYGLVVPVP